MYTFKNMNNRRDKLSPYQLEQVKSLLNHFFNRISVEDTVSYMLRLFIITEECELHQIQVVRFYDVFNTTLGGVIVYDKDVLVYLLQLITVSFHEKQICLVPSPDNALKYDPTCFNTNMKNSTQKYEVSEFVTIYICDYFKPSQRKLHSKMELSAFISTYCKRYDSSELLKFERNNQLLSSSNYHQSLQSHHPFTINSESSESRNEHSVIIPANTVILTSLGTIFTPKEDVFYDATKCNKTDMSNFYDEKIKHFQSFHSWKELCEKHFSNKSRIMFHPTMTTEEYSDYASNGKFDSSQVLAALVFTEKSFRELYYNKDGIYSYFKLLQSHEDMWNQRMNQNHCDNNDMNNSKNTQNVQEKNSSRSSSIFVQNVLNRRRKKIEMSEVNHFSEITKNESDEQYQDDINLQQYQNQKDEQNDMSSGDEQTDFHYNDKKKTTTATTATTTERNSTKHLIMTNKGIYNPKRYEYVHCFRSNTNNSNINNISTIYSSNYFYQHNVNVNYNNDTSSDIGFTSVSKLNQDNYKVTNNHDKCINYMDPDIPYDLDDSFLDYLKPTIINDEHNQLKRQKLDDLKDSKNFKKAKKSQLYFELTTNKNKLSKNFLQCVSRTLSDVLHQTLPNLPIHQQQQYRIKRNLQKNIEIMEQLIEKKSRHNLSTKLYENYLQQMQEVLEHLNEFETDYNDQKNNLYTSTFLRAFLDHNLPAYVLQKEEEMKENVKEDINEEMKEDLS